MAWGDWGRMDRNGPASVFLRLLRTLLHTRPPEVNELSQQLSLGYKLGKTQAGDGITALLCLV